MPDLEFFEMLETYRVNLFRQSLPIESGKNADDVSVNVGDVGENAVNDGNAKDIAL